MPAVKPPVCFVPAFFLQPMTPAEEANQVIEGETYTKSITLSTRALACT